MLRRFIIIFTMLSCIKLTAQQALANQGNTGLPAPMLYDTGDPITKTYPCSTTVNMGIPFYNMSSGISRPLWICNGTTWVQASPAISASTVSFGGSALLLGGSVSQSTSVTGAVVGNNCIATRADGTLLAVGLAIDCNVPTNGTVNVRISALIAGTPSAGIYNIRIFQ